MSFPHDYDDVMRLSDKEAEKYLYRIIEGIWDQVDASSFKDTLASLLEAFDQGAGDLFGTEGWRRGLLGEDT